MATDLWPVFKWPRVAAFGWPPRPTGAAAKRYVAEMTGAPVADSPVPGGPPSPETSVDTLWIESDTESEPVRNVVEMVAPLFANNPRRVKQFLNVFRLQAYIAGETALFRKRGSPGQTMTLPKLAKVTAILLRYPTLAERLRDCPKLLATLQHSALAPDAGADDGDDPLIKLLLTTPAVVRLLAFRGRDEEYRLDELDVIDLLAIVPAQPRRGLSQSRMREVQDEFASINADFIALLEGG